MSIISKLKETVIRFIQSLDNFIDITTECSNNISKFLIKGYPTLLSFIVCVSCILGVIVYISIIVPWVFGLWLIDKVK